MNEILKITELLGEDNTKRLRDGITELLLNTIRNDLEDMDTYLIDFDDLFEDVRRDVFDNVRDKMIKRYTNEIENKFESLLKLLDTGLVVPDDKTRKETDC